MAEPRTTRSRALLDGHHVLAQGRGRYWQFSPGRRRGMPLMQGAAYVAVEHGPALEQLLDAELEWFIPHGVTRLSAAQVDTLIQSLRTASRMPDEPAHDGLWTALAEWLIANGTDGVCIQEQRFV